MAKKKTVQTKVIKLVRGFMFKGEMITATESGGKGKEDKPVVIEVPLALARELVANGKAEFTDDKKTSDFNFEEDEDEFADL